MNKNKKIEKISKIIKKKKKNIKGIEYKKKSDNDKFKFMDFSRVF